VIARASSATAAEPSGVNLAPYGSPRHAKRVCFIVESGTDARMLEGLAARVDLTALVRAVPGGHAISQPTGVTVRMRSSNRLVFAVSAFCWLITNRCDSVLVQGYGVAALAANAACRIRRRPCWMLVCSPVAEYYATRRIAGQGFSKTTLAGIHTLARFNARLGRGYVVLSDYLRTVVMRYAPARPVHVIPVYGVDPQVFTPGPADKASLRRTRGLPATGAVIFNSSRVAPEKDIDTLIEAFRRLVADGRNVYLFHRSGGHREFLRVAETAGVRSRVIATDAVDPRQELPLDYLASDVCVQASREEGLGFSVLEALACGTPVVATAVGGLVQVVKDGETGWTARPGDAAGLAAALRDALDRPEEARRRTAVGAAIVRAHFDSRQAFDQLAGLLAEPL
jgi:glycosyltransferase involved in cell wall biosynthesis